MVFYEYKDCVECRENICFDNNRAHALLMHTVACIVLVIIGLLSFRNTVASPILVGDRGSYDLSGYMSVLEDPYHRMTLQDVLAAKAGEGFVPLQGPFNAGYSRSAFWFSFTLERGKGFPEQGWLRFSPSYLDDVTIYTPLPTKDPMQASSYRANALGLMVPAENMPLRHPEFVAPIDLDADNPVTIYVRVVSNSTINFTGSLHTYADLMEYTALYMFRQSAYLGIALLIALMTMILFIAVRDEQFLFFSLYVLILFFSYLTIKGMHFILFPSLPPIIGNLVSGIVFGAGLIVHALFALSLFRDFSYRFSFIYLKLMIVVGIVSMAAVPIGMYAVILPRAVNLAFGLIVVMFWMSFRSFVHEPRYWIFYVLAFGVNGFAYVSLFLQNLGVVPFHDLTMNALQLLSVLNILLIFLALTDRLRSGELRILENSRMTEQRAIAIAGEMTHELKENKERLEISLLAELQSTERLQRFLVMLSHEYRTPLAIIQGNIDLLERQIMQQCSGCQPEFMKMRRAVQRLVEVMDVSLEQSRLAEPRATEDYQCVPVGRFVAKQINTVRLMWPEKTFRLDSLPDAGLLYGELPLLNTALFNLLDNARKYSPSSTQVAVSCRNGGRVAVIRITNEIEGFLPDNTERLFEKYHRGTNVAAIGGAGVGLWLVRQIVTRHGGRVHLRCRKEGFVTVTLMLPLFLEGKECGEMSENVSPFSIGGMTGGNPNDHDTLK